MTELTPGLQDHWDLPERGTKVFCELPLADGEVTEAWAEDRFLDRRFIRSYETWVPR